jgi:hypothetical protein
MRILRRTLLQLPAAAWAASSPAPQHKIVFGEKGRFGGWPANHHMWAWGNELVVGFEAGYFRTNTEKTREHAIDYSKPAAHVLARSLDGGETWKIEEPETLKAPPGTKQAGVPCAEGGKPMSQSPGGFDFTKPGFAFTARMASIHTGPSRFYVSYDKAHTWQGPFEFPNLGTPGIAARTDALIDGKHEMTVFMTAAKTNLKEGRVLCARTTDGAKTWKMINWVCPEPADNDFAIMPSSVRLSGKSILTTIRHRKFIAAWRSDDNGASWNMVGQPVDDTGGGNPPALLKLPGGKLVLTYGFRNAPYSIRARTSTDEGKTWSKDIMLREDGGSWDLGYTRTVRRPDGNLVTAYYYNTNQGSERFIGATIWKP